MKIKIEVFCAANIHIYFINYKKKVVFLHITEITAIFAVKIYYIT